MTDVSLILRRVAAGEPGAGEGLLAVVYGDARNGYRDDQEARQRCRAMLIWDMSNTMASSPRLTHSGT